MKKVILLIALSYLVFNFNACKTEPPTANFEVSKTKVYIGESVSFVNKTSEADSYLWDFGDNATSTDPNPTHVYSTGGTKTVILTATNKSGSDNFILKVNVFNGKSSYQVKNSTSISLVLASFYYDGSNIVDFVNHGTMAVGAMSDTTYTSRSVLNLGGTMAGVTFIVTSDYPIKNNQHNILEITNSSPIYKNAEIKSGDMELSKLNELLKK